MRSASSTCAGRPEAIRPATYLTSGEYATTSRSRARSPPDVGGREPAAGLRQEQRGLATAAVEGVARALQVAPERAQGGLPRGHEAGLAALALDAHLLAVEVDRADVERDQLLGAQPGGV